MISLENIRDILQHFQPVSLSEMDGVKLLNRSEKKYVFHFSKVEAVLMEALKEYKVLEIQGQRLQEYSTEYFDTHDNAMYLAHHNGRQNRIKVRRREYVISGEQFLEVKRRTNAGRTQKKRVELQGDASDQTSGQVFIEKATPYTLEGLEVKLINSFHRITLVNAILKERITIDLGLEFRNDNQSVHLPSIAIIEIKFDRAQEGLGFDKIMNQLRIHDSSVSKYCIGRALLEPKLKANLFRNKIRFITKLNALVHDRRRNN